MKQKTLTIFSSKLEIKLTKDAKFSYWVELLTEKQINQKIFRVLRRKQQNPSAISLFPDKESQHDYQPSISER